MRIGFDINRWTWVKLYYLFVSAFIRGRRLVLLILLLPNLRRNTIKTVSARSLFSVPTCLRTDNVLLSHAIFLPRRRKSTSGSQLGANIGLIQLVPTIEVISFLKILLSLLLMLLIAILPGSEWFFVKKEKS